MLRRAKEKRHQKKTRSGARLGAYRSVVASDPFRLVTPSRTMTAPSIWPQVLIKLPALVLLLGSLWLLNVLFRSDSFRVQGAIVEGGKLIGEEDVERTLRLAGVSIFRIDASQVAQRLKSEYAYLEHVSVSCRLPNRVHIVLVERSAAQIWQSGGRSWWVDMRGEVLGPVKETQGQRDDLIVINDLKGFAPDPQGRIIKVPWKLAQEVQRAMPAIKTYDYTPETGLIIYVTAAGWPVYLGHEGDAQTKIAVLRPLVDQLVAARVNVAYIDLRNEQRPTYERR